MGAERNSSGGTQQKSQFHDKGDLYGVWIHSTGNRQNLRPLCWVFCLSLPAVGHEGGKCLQAVGCERTRLHELKKDKTALSDVADADHSTMLPDPLSDWPAVSLRCRVPRRMPSVIFDPSPTPTFPLSGRAPD
ncbi:hypothetical protein CPAR01_02325 [Colletotrichum paranaense]|uniref:Uncharacterized protein n=1 Tax=Colletotrichum paranaense TaxID=1914294 RepID=A0ABQ9SZ95_9PEZI|nr:uncharacterized protein CPAR01_02325 [Colletotrichum paranaense]KAK1544823.1 hypothetical protein CPAR01_02325 [Colletotrichum paranaense]